MPLSVGAVVVLCIVAMVAFVVQRHRKLTDEADIAMATSPYMDQVSNPLAETDETIEGVAKPNPASAPLPTSSSPAKVTRLTARRQSSADDTRASREYL
jgi:hypothetical protein